MPPKNTITASPPEYKTKFPFNITSLKPTEPVKAPYGYNSKLIEHRLELQKQLEHINRTQEQDLARFINGKYSSKGYTVIWRGDKSTPKAPTTAENNYYRNNEYAKTDIELYPNHKNLPCKSEADYNNIRNPFRIKRDETLPVIFVEVKDYRVREYGYDDVSQLALKLRANIITQLAEDDSDIMELYRADQKAISKQAKSSMNDNMNCFFYPSDKINDKSGRSVVTFTDPDDESKKITSTLDYAHIDELYPSCKKYIICRYNWSGDVSNGIDLITEYTTALFNTYDENAKSGYMSFYIPMNKFAILNRSSDLHSYFNNTGIPVENFYDRATADVPAFYGAKGVTKLEKNIADETRLTKGMRREMYDEPSAYRTINLGSGFFDKIPRALRSKYKPLNPRREKLAEEAASELRTELAEFM